MARIDSGRPPEPADWQRVGAGRYALKVPEKARGGHKQALLRVRYRGDVGHAFAGNALISDNFCNGAPWDIRVDCWADALKDQPLVLYLTPVKTNVTVDASAMAGLRERADTEAAELLGAEWILVDDFTLREGEKEK